MLFSSNAPAKKKDLLKKSLSIYQVFNLPNILQLLVSLDTLIFNEQVLLTEFSLKLWIKTNI